MRQLRSFTRQHRRLFEGVGAGVLLDFGVYPIVLALQAMGPVRDLRAAIVRNAVGVDVHASLQLEHAGGGHSQLVASLVATLPNRTTLSAARGNVQLESPVMGAERLQVRHALPSVAAPASGDGTKQRIVAALRQQRWLRKLRSALAGGGASEHSFGANRYAPLVAHFVSLLDAGALDSGLMPQATSLEVLRIVDAARAVPDNAEVGLIS